METKFHLYKYKTQDTDQVQTKMFSQFPNFVVSIFTLNINRIISIKKLIDRRKTMFWNTNKYVTYCYPQTHVHWSSEQEIIFLNEETRSCIKQIFTQFFVL